MALKPKLSDVPRIRGALRLYRVFAYITGTMLLLLVLEMVFKYTPIQRELELGGAHGFIALVPDGQVLAVNLSLGILIAHGWLYVVYLFSDFRLWSIMRWPFSRFIAIALGGVVPFLSFIVEHFITKRALRELAELEASAPAASPVSATAPEVSH
jgi:integral membrane protein